MDSWYNQTTLHPIGLLALVVLGLATYVVPRRYALVPLMILACFISPAQRIVIGTFDFNTIRILVLVGWIRVLFRGEITSFRWKPLDVAVIAWTICASTAAVLLNTTVASFVNRLGFAYDAVGLYFLVRFTIRSWNDVFIFARSVAVISIPVAVAFLIEKATGRNLFAIFGGVPELTTVRAGRLRCQGPFSHPILAGCFWATLAPLTAALWWRRGLDRILGVTGVAASLVVIFACTSATPLNGAIFGVAAAALFPLRRWMGWIRWSAAVGVILLHMVMNNPVWYLLARFNTVSNATGWYRYKLIDEFLGHFDEWWFLGTTSYGSWYQEGFFEAITNEYVLQGINGGLLTLLLFITVIILAFVNIGRICREAVRRRLRLVPARAGHQISSPPRRGTQPRPRSARLAMGWGLGISLFVHCLVFTSVSYFGQSVLAWYITIGIIGSLVPSSRRASRVLMRLRRRPVERTPGAASDPPHPLPAPA